MADRKARDEDYYTLLGVRADGVAPVVDLVFADRVEPAKLRAKSMLAEHQSCRTVEVWRGGALVWSVARDERS